MFVQRRVPSVITKRNMSQCVVYSAVRAKALVISLRSHDVVEFICRPSAPSLGLTAVLSLLSVLKGSRTINSINYHRKAQGDNAYAGVR
jgi:hypothetical protein